MDSKTIFYIGGFELPDKNAAAHRVLGNAKILRDLGYRVVLIGVDKSLPWKQDIFATCHDVQGFQCLSVPYPKSSMEWIGYLSDISMIRNAADRYPDLDAVICYNYPAAALMRLKSYCRSKGIRIMADCTEWYSTRGSSILFKIIKGTDSFLRMRILQKQMDGLIVISRFLGNYYSKCRNVAVIPPLADLNEEKWKISSDTENESSQTGIRFAYAGSPGKTKDKLGFIIDLLGRIQDNRNYLFSVIGITKEQYLEMYPNHTELLSKLDGKVVFYGRVSHQESIDHIKNADFSLFIREDSRLTRAGFPTKFVESISCGTPVITTKTSDLEEYLQVGENGYFIDITDRDEAVALFEKILGMPHQEMKRMKENCRQSRMFHFEKYKELLQSVINNLSQER